MKNRNLSRNKKCRFCDFFGYQAVVQNHEVQVHRNQIDERDQYELESQQTHLRFTNQRFEMPAPVVVYANFESAINEKNRHKPIMLSCLAVSLMLTIHTQLQVFHTSHEEESDLLPFMDYLIRLRESVKRYLFNELPLEVTQKVDKDYQYISVCPFCHKKLESDKVRHNAHVSGEYSNGVRRSIMRMDNTFAPVAISAIYNSHSTRRTTDCQCTSTMDLTTISHSS